MLDIIELDIDVCLEGVKEKSEGCLISPGRGVDLGMVFLLNMYTGISISLELLDKEKGSVSLLKGKAAMV